MYFENIIGQDFAKRYTINSINKDKISHAYMFEGIKGIGKNKFAIELGKILLNINNIENSPDYINILPEGSSIKISQVRAIQSDIVVKPHGKYKIYVIDQSEKMTVEAQNALLKTLEEPPNYAIIILITSNKDALLDTIKSRCEIIKFNPLSIKDITNYLVDKDIEEEKSKILATFSRGSISKAIELSNSDEFKLMRDDIQQYINVIIEKDVVILLDIGTVLDKYKDKIVEVLDIIITYFRDVMLLKESVHKDMIINIDKLTYIENLNKKINYSQVSKIIDIIEETKKKITSNCNFNVSLQVMALNIYEVIK